MKLRVSTKLYATIGVLLLAAVVMAASSGWYLYRTGVALEQAINSTSVKLDQVNLMRALMWEMAATMRATYVYASINAADKVEAATQAWESAHARMQRSIAETRPLLETEEGRRMLDKIESHTANYATQARTYLGLTKARKLEEAAALCGKIAVFLVEFDQTGLEFRAQQLGMLKQSDVEGEALREQGRWVSGGLSVLVLVVGIMGLGVARGIGRSLRSVIADLRSGAEQVASAATQVAASSQSLAQGSSEQAASLEETSASSQEIQALSRKNSESTRRASQLMKQSHEKYQDANRWLDESVEAMAELSAQSDRISKIIKTIDEIAFQTNILALNAAVEAARAGEAGMGFAVVADEVRTLSQRCSQAASDTEELIEGSIARSNGGKAKVDQVAESIRSILKEAEQVKELVDEVSQGSQEQTAGLEQIGKAIVQMEQVTQRSASSAEEGASLAQELTAQSQSLKGVVERLTVLVGSE